MTDKGADNTGNIIWDDAYHDKKYRGALSKEKLQESLEETKKGKTGIENKIKADAIEWIKTKIKLRVADNKQNIFSKMNEALITLIEGETKRDFVKEKDSIEKGDKDAQEIHTKIIQEYLDHNYPILNIPIFPSESIQKSISKRADFILSKLEGLIDD
mgnify:CR=1 FL=1